MTGVQLITYGDPLGRRLTGIYRVNALFQFWIFDLAATNGVMLASLDASRTRHPRVLEEWVRQCVDLMTKRYVALFRAQLGLPFVTEAEVEGR